ncbi:MAG: trypsin-like serine protease [Proteobacteria bacterium]|nr:trypsin-like serine protease [Pseudomonadota bacterium]
MNIFNRLGALAVAGLALIALGTGAAQATDNRSISAANVDTLRQATVHIRNLSTAENGTFSRSIGSGYLIDNQRCIVVTNAHVVENSAFLTIYRWSDVEQTNPIRARIVGFPDPSIHNDIAIVQMESCAGMPQVRLGNSDMVNVGDTVIAIGSPLGLADTVTVGVISKNPRLGFSDAPGGYIQTDAAINPGNSGGPLFNDRGEVVGMNSAIISRSGGSQGLGLAIPVNVVKRAISQVLANGAPSWPVTGAATESLTKSSARTLGVPADVLEKGATGVVITGVTADSAAAKAGLQVRDIIVSFGGYDVVGPLQFRELVNMHKAGDTVTLMVVRDKALKTLTLTLDEGFVKPTATPAEAYEGFTGMRVQSLKDVYRDAFKNAFDLLPPTVREQMEERGMDFDAVIERMAAAKAAEFGALANAPVISYIYNHGPAHEAAIDGPRFQVGALPVLPGLTLPLREPVMFATVSGVVAEGDGFAYEAITSAEQLNAYVARAAAANRKVVLELTVVAKVGDEESSSLHEEREEHMALKGTAETDENGLRRKRVFIELTPRAFNAN